MDSKRKWIWPALFLLLLTAVELFAIASIHRENHADIVFDSFRVFHGWAEWRIYQSRILLPFTIGVISRLTGIDFGVIRELLLATLIIGSNFTIFALLIKRFGDFKLAAKITFLHVLFFVYFQTKIFYYDWDVLDQLVFFVLGYAILDRKPIGWFIGLFALELLNREAAAFVGLAVLIEAAFNLELRFEKRILRAGLGIVMVAASMVVTRELRIRLHKDIARENLLEPMLGGQMWKLPLNLAELTPPWNSIKFVYPWLIMGLFGTLSLRAWQSGYPPARRLILLGGAITLSLFLFAVLSEVRVWVPILAFSALLAIPPDRWTQSRVEKESSRPDLVPEGSDGV